MSSPLTPDLLRRKDAYRHAVDCLSVGQIYFLDKGTGGTSSTGGDNV